MKKVAINFFLIVQTETQQVEDPAESNNVVKQHRDVLKSIMEVKDAHERSIVQVENQLEKR